MNEADALGLLQSTIWTIVMASGPASSRQWLWES